MLARTLGDAVNLVAVLGKILTYHLDECDQELLFLFGHGLGASFVFVGLPYPARRPLVAGNRRSNS
jgi:hypothetical protein